MAKEETTYFLSEMEYKVLKLLVQGKTNIQIGKELFISPSTAKVHVGNIFRKINVTGRVQATVKALKENII